MKQKIQYQSIVSYIYFINKIFQNILLFLTPEMVFQVSVQEIHNSMVITPEKSLLKEVRDEENNIINSEYMLNNIFSYQFKKLSTCCKVIYGCEC